MSSTLQGIHAVVVLAVVVAYSYYMLKAMNKQFVQEINTNLEKQYQQNPNLKEDLMKYREELQHEEEQKKQVEALEEEQRNIAAKIEELKAKANPTLKRLQEASTGGIPRTKYVEMAGVTVQDDSETRWSFQDPTEKRAKPSSRRSVHRAKAHEF